MKYIRVLTRKAPIIAKIKFIVEHLKSLGMDESLFNQPYFKQFLGSQFVSNFLYILEIFGFEIKRPEDLQRQPVSRMIEKERKKRNFRGFVWDRPGYVTKIEKDKFRHFEEAAEWDMERNT